MQFCTLRLARLLPKEAIAWPEQGQPVHCPRLTHRTKCQCHEADIAEEIQYALSVTPFADYRYMKEEVHEEFQGSLWGVKCDKH